MEVKPYQTRIDKIYMALQRGDEEMSEKKPLQHRLFDGMISYIDPKEWTTPPCLSSYNQGETLWIELPRTKANIRFLKNAVSPLNNNVINPKTEMNYKTFRRTKNFIDHKDIADLPEVKKVEPDLMLKVRTHKHRIPVIKIKRLPKNLVKDSSIINIMREPIIETGQITTGLYTIGPAGGDNYPTYSGVGGFVSAIGANQTGALIGRNTGPVTEAATALTSHNQGGFNFIIDSDTPNLGNYLTGHFISVNVAGHFLSLRHNGPGNTSVRDLKALRILAGGIANHSFIHDGGVGVSWTGHYCNNMFNGAGLQGGGIYSSDGDPILLVYKNMLFDFGNDALLLDAADGNANSIYENNSIYLAAGNGVSINNNPGTFRNNAVLGCGTNFANIGGATGRNNGSSDATGANAAWLAGTGNQINLVAAAQWESLVAALGDPFLRPLTDSTLDTAGIGATYATTLINGVPQLVTIGAKGRIIPAPTGITRQSHTAIHTGLGIF